MDALRLGRTAGFTLVCLALGLQVKTHQALAADRSEIKTLFLNPTAFYERDVHVEGHIRVMGVGESWFVIEDGTGRLLVTTTSLAAPLPCRQGARVGLRGRLLSLGDEHGLYFALRDMDGCSISLSPWTRRLAEWFGLGQSWQDPSAQSTMGH